MVLVGVLLCACIELLQSSTNEPVRVEEPISVSGSGESDQETRGSRREIRAVSTSRKNKRSINEKGRQSSSRPSVRKENAFSATGIDKVINTKCCKKGCTKKVLNKGDVLKCRKVYRSLSEEEQRSFIRRFFTLSVYHHQGLKYSGSAPLKTELCDI